MSWEKPYVILRVDESGKAKEVHTAASLKDARYWLTYIAEAGDAMFLTPAHPKCAGSTELKYHAHLVSRGKVEYNEELWKSSFLGGKGFELEESSPAA